MTSTPFDDAAEANEADVAEQQRDVTEDDSPRNPPAVPLDEASEADILEQGAEVREDDDY